MPSENKIDKLIEKPLLGLPIRMVFLCSWHRLHTVLIFLGFLVICLSKLLKNEWLEIIGEFILAPSALCFLLFFTLTPLFVLYEKLFSQK